MCFGKIRALINHQHKHEGYSSHKSTLCVCVCGSLTFFGKNTVTTLENYALVIFKIQQLGSFAEEQSSKSCGQCPLSIAIN